MTAAERWDEARKENVRETSKEIDRLIRQKGQCEQKRRIFLLIQDQDEFQHQSLLNRNQREIWRNKIIELGFLQLWSQRKIHRQTNAWIRCLDWIFIFLVQRILPDFLLIRRCSNTTSTWLVQSFIHQSRHFVVVVVVVCFFSFEIIMDYSVCVFFLRQAVLRNVKSVKSRKDAEHVPKTPTWM